jgi:hypothetical protein
MTVRRRGIKFISPSRFSHGCFDRHFCKSYSRFLAYSTDCPSEKLEFDNVPSWPSPFPARPGMIKPKLGLNDKYDFAVVGSEAREL